jgi:Ca-activated chloride channel homolog
LLKANTNDARLKLNAGISAYQAKDFSTANRHLMEASQAPDLKLQQQAYYNLGNSLYRSGENDDPQKRQLWEQAVRSYQNALALDKQDTNAQYNLDFVKQRIQELPPPQPNQDQKQDQNQDQNQDQSTNAPPQPQNQPESKQQDNPQDQKSQEQQQPSQPQPTSNQDEKKEQSQNQASEENQSENQDQAQSNPSPNDQDQNRTNQAASARQSAPQMTPEQAARVLDAQKAEERPLIFTPEKPPNRDRAFKDW